MTIQEHQNGEGTQRAPQDIGEPAKSPDNSRRSFAKSGLVASGVLLTLSSRPVLGASVCVSPSGFESGNLSFHGTPILCAGLTPGYYMNHTDWPSPYVADKTTTTSTVVSSGPKKIGQKASYTSITSAPTTTTTTILGTKFSSVFNCSGYGKQLASFTLMQVIGLTGWADPQQLGAHCVAALLNAASGKTPVLNPAQVKNIFNEFDSKGYFEPTVGQKWYPGDIVAYLKTTMPL